MTRRERTHAFCSRAWLIGLLVVAGCAHSTRELQDRLADRVRPLDVGAGKSTSQGEGKVALRATKDATVQPAVALQPKEGRAAPPESDRATPLPPAIIASPGRVDSDQPTTATNALPSDSDEATLDAIAANGKAADACRGGHTGLSVSTSVACPAREHRSGPGATADRIFDVPAHRRRQLRRG